MHARGVCALRTFRGRRGDRGSGCDAMDHVAVYKQNIYIYIYIYIYTIVLITISIVIIIIVINIVN